MPAGRPRAFDMQKALDAALNVFWRKGYEGTSLPDLTQAMGINRPSLYAAFGNKEDLFRQVLDRYGEKGSATRDALAERTARGVIEKMLLGVADARGNTVNPPGCLMVSGALAGSDEAESVRTELIARRAAGEKVLRERLARAKKEGDLSVGRDPEKLAGYVTTVMQGMAVQAASGTSREDLTTIARLAMKALPV